MCYPAPPDEDDDDKPDRITDPLIGSYLQQLDELNIACFINVNHYPINKDQVTPLLRAMLIIQRVAGTVAGLYALDGMMRLTFPGEYGYDPDDTLDSLTNFPLSGEN